MSENEPRPLLLFLSPIELERLRAARPAGQRLEDFAAALLAERLAESPAAPEPAARPPLALVKPDAPAKP